MFLVFFPLFLISPQSLFLCIRCIKRGSMRAFRTFLAIGINRDRGYSAHALYYVRNILSAENATKGSFCTIKNQALFNVNKYSLSFRTFLKLNEVSGIK